jgi:uncharacterized protein with FMN-binding domain
MIKKIAIVAGVILLIVVVGAGIMMSKLAGMAHSIEAENAKVSKVDLSKISDGNYSGSYGDFVVFASVEVAVRNHRIEKITIKDQKCGKGYEALATIDRIIKAQSPKVDAIAGASSSSRSIMVAVFRALTRNY